jgi:hypothetical protein
MVVCLSYFTMHIQECYYVYLTLQSYCGEPYLIDLHILILIGKHLQEAIRELQDHTFDISATLPPQKKASYQNEKHHSTYNCNFSPD